MRLASSRPAAQRWLAQIVGIVLAVATGAAGADELSDLRERLEAQGFRIQSADAANVARLRGVLHFDGRYFPDDVTSATADTWLLRRVRPTLEGTLNGIFDYRFTPDFAGGRSIILDAFLAARIKPWAVVTAGKFKVPVGLERLVAATDLRFIERALPTSLVPNRDLGLQLGGEISGGLVSYSVGYFNGVSDGGSRHSSAIAHPLPQAARRRQSTARLRMVSACAGRRRLTTTSAASACSANTCGFRRT